MKQHWSYRPGLWLVRRGHFRVGRLALWPATAWTALAVLASQR